MKSPALLVTARNTLELGEVTLPDLGPNDVLVENAFSAISPGTELRCLAGLQPGSEEWPFVPGYCVVGRVVAAGRTAALAEGTWVVGSTASRLADARTMWGGHIARAVCPAAGLYPLPAGIPLAEAALTKLAAIPYHGLRLARPLPHETVVVVGLGPIGHLAARLYRLTGARVIAVDSAPHRVEQVRALGIEATLTGGDLAASVRALAPEGADVVVDTTGVSTLPAAAVEALRDHAWGDHPEVSGPRYVVQGSYAGDVTFPYNPFFFREASLLVPRSETPHDNREILRMLGRGQLSLAGVSGEPVAPSRAPEIYESLRARTAPFLTATFRWNDSPPTT